MKKLLSVILLVCMIPLFASAEDLTDLTFDQLITLRDQINAEIVSRPEWKETEVPAGHWVVGEDIPAGTYSITCTSHALIRVWKKAVNDYSNSGLLFNQAVKKETIGKISLEAGWIFDTSGVVIFAPPQSLGF